MAKKEPAVITKDEIHSVRFTFSDIEINIKAKRLADHSATLANLHQELSVIKEQYKSKINSEQAAINELVGHIGSGYEYRRVDCVVKMHTPELGLKTYFYDGEPIYDGIEKMLPSDYQTVMAFPDKGDDQDTVIDIEYDMNTEIHQVKSFQKLKDVFQLQKESGVVMDLNDFLDRSKRLGTGKIYKIGINSPDAQSLRSHLDQIKAMESLLNFF